MATAFPWAVMRPEDLLRTPGINPNAPTPGLPTQGMPQAQAMPQRQGGVAARLTDPRLLSFLASLGAALSQPRQVGQSGMQQWNQALAMGYGGMQNYSAQRAAQEAAMAEARRKAELENREQTRKEYDTASQIGARKSSADTAQEQATTGRIKVEGDIKNQSDRLKFDQEKWEDELGFRREVESGKVAMDMETVAREKQKLEYLKDNLAYRTKVLEANQNRQAANAEERTRQQAIKNANDKARIAVMQQAARTAAARVAAQMPAATKYDLALLKMATDTVNKKYEALQWTGQLPKNPDTGKDLSPMELDAKIQAEMQATLAFLRGQMPQGTTGAPQGVQAPQGTGTATGGKRATRAQVAAYAKQKGVSQQQAESEFMQQGYVIE